MMRQSLILALLLALCASCKQKPDGQSASPAREESRQAKAMLLQYGQVRAAVDAYLNK